MAYTSASVNVIRQLHIFCRQPTTSRLSIYQVPRLVHSSTCLRNKALESKLHGFFNASEKNITKLQLKDNISKNYTLIYKAPMETYFKYGYSVMLLCTIAAPTLMVYSFYVKGKILLQKEAHSIPFFNPEKEIWIFVGSMILLACAFSAMMFKYPLRIYKHNEKKEYVAMFLSTVPLKIRQFHFQSAYKKKFRNPLYFFIDDCFHYFLNSKKKVFIFAHYFRKPADLCEMEGMEMWKNM